MNCLQEFTPKYPNALYGARNGNYKAYVFGYGFHFLMQTCKNNKVLKQYWFDTLEEAKQKAQWALQPQNTKRMEKQNE